MHACMQARMQSIMQRIQQLLSLLTAAVTSATGSSVTAAVAVEDLQQRAAALQASSPKAAAHLRHLAAAAEALAAPATPTGSTARIQECMTTIHDGMLRSSCCWHPDAAEKVLEGSAALHRQLAQGTDSEKLREAVDMLQVTADSFSRRVGSLRREMAEDVAEIRAHLARLARLPDGGA